MGGGEMERARKRSQRHLHTANKPGRSLSFNATLGYTKDWLFGVNYSEGRIGFLSLH